MKSLVARLLIALVTFGAGLLCVALSSRAGALGLGWLKDWLPWSVLGGSAVCFAVASLSEARRRERKPDAAVALTLATLLGGFSLLLTGLWLLWRAWIWH